MTYLIIDRTDGSIIGTASDLNGARRITRKGGICAGCSYRRA